MNVLLIALLVVREASRRRLVLVGALLTIFLIALTGWGFERLATAPMHYGQPIPHGILMGICSRLVIMIAFMFSIILSLGAAFLGAVSAGAEIENGTLLAIVPRPLTRIELLTGKWLGNAALIVGFAIVVECCEVFVVHATTGYFPPNPLEATAFLIAEALLVLTLTMWLSIWLSAIAAGFSAVVLFAVAWLGGIVGVIASSIGNVPLHDAATVLSLIVPTDGIWRATAFGLEPAAMAAAAAINAPANSNPFISGTMPNPAYLLWCLGWFTCVACAGLWTFSRRDI